MDARSTVTTTYSWAYSREQGHNAVIGLVRSPTRYRYRRRPTRYVLDDAVAL